MKWFPINCLFFFIVFSLFLSETSGDNFFKSLAEKASKGLCREDKDCDEDSICKILIKGHRGMCILDIIPTEERKKKREQSALEKLQNEMPKATPNIPVKDPEEVADEPEEIAVRVPTRRNCKRVIRIRPKY